MTTYSIPLPWPKPPLTSNRTRGNPYARAKEVAAARDAARWAIRGLRLAVTPPVEVSLHLRVATKHRRDSDGLYPTLKAVLDALVLEQVLPDDSWQYVPATRCAIHAPNGQPAAMWAEIRPLTSITPTIHQERP